MQHAGSADQHWPLTGGVHRVLTTTAGLGGVHGRVGVTEHGREIVIGSIPVAAAAGRLGPDDGTVAPWVVLASLPFAPEIVLPTVRSLAGVKLGGKHRPYGFRCSFNRTFRMDDSPTAIITFEDEGGKTRYTATVRHWSAEDKKTHEEMGFHPGWGQCADQLAALAKTI